MASRYTLYSDFNCPFCYALGERLATLGVADRIAWRGVQHAPHLPIPMATAGPAFARDLAHEVAMVTRLAPDVPIALPRGKPNTGPAIRAVAAARRIAPPTADVLTGALYRAFWQDGRDISNPTVISELAAFSGIAMLSVGDEDARTAAAWQDEWWDRGVGSVPELVRDDGDTLQGLVDLETLRRFVRLA